MFGTPTQLRNLPFGIRGKAFIGLVLFALAVLRVSASGAEQPNVIFIFIDDQGYYDLGCYGATEVETPRIDALAQRGVRFTDYYAASPICSASRAGLLTGAYPRRTGNEIWVHRPDSEEGIPADWLTVGELFKTAGYATACIGKWHLGFGEEHLPRAQGFDHYYGYLHNMDLYEAAHYKDEGGMPLLRNGKVLERNTNPGLLAGMYTDEAISWIEQRVSGGSRGKPDQPFFIYLPHTMLHKPLGVSEKFEGSSNFGLYGDAIQEMDYHVGRIVDALQRLEIDDDTIVVYASDNGREAGRNADQPLRGRKLTSFEAGIRVPCIAYGPGAGVAQGVETNAVAHAMDWYPTLASLAGIKIPRGVTLDGRDLSALLKGETDGIPAFDEGVSLNAEVPLRRTFEPDLEWSELFTQEEYLNAFFYHGPHGEFSAVRSGKWKLALGLKSTLYDLENDPAEMIELRAPWPKNTLVPPEDPEERALWINWKVTSKLRGMAIQFQTEMNRWNKR